MDELLIQRLQPMISIDYDDARRSLQKAFGEAESAFHAKDSYEIPEDVAEHCETLFQCRTQAYREVLLGCVLVRILNKDVNIRHPYTTLSDQAFSGRALDERVVNPFLQEKRIPCSKGPYLSVFRRSVEFCEDTGKGLRDKDAYSAFLAVLSYAESTSDDDKLDKLLVHLLVKFLELREESHVRVLRLKRVSLAQFDRLISRLLACKSEGRFPVMIVVSAFETLKHVFNLAWEVEWQGINVADAATGAGGDVMIRSGGRIVLAAEVTERPISKDRIVQTFNTKIMLAGLDDYLFFVDLSKLDEEAKAQTREYFSQGYEVNFVDLKQWLLMILATVGSQGRTVFFKTMVALLEDREVPAWLKLKWNESIQDLTN